MRKICQKGKKHFFLSSITYLSIRANGGFMEKRKRESRGSKWNKSYIVGIRNFERVEKMRARFGFEKFCASYRRDEINHHVFVLNTIYLPLCSFSLSAISKIRPCDLCETLHTSERDSVDECDSYSSRTRQDLAGGGPKNRRKLVPNRFHSWNWFRTCR